MLEISETKFMSRCRHLVAQNRPAIKTLVCEVSMKVRDIGNTIAGNC